MKVLLCAPYKAGPQYEHGGIEIWTENIVEYYHTLNSDIHLDVAPFNRKVNNRNGFLSRLFGGIVDYSHAIKGMARMLKNRYDVLHLCTSASMSLVKDYIVLKITKRKGVKTVVHFHFGRIPELEQHHNWEWFLLKWIIKVADAVVTLDMKSYYAINKQGIKTAHYLPNPLSLAIMRQIAATSTDIEREKRKICFVGHVIPAKGVMELVDACKSIDGIQLHIVGKVSQSVRNHLAHIANGGDWLVFDGEVNHTCVIQTMLSSSIFVLPSYTEGFPNVILESMASGCAIVATDVGAIPEMLDIESKNPCGLCSRPRDVDGLHNNIVFFLDNPDYAREYAVRAVNRVNQFYAIPSVWKQMVSIWNGCLGA